MLGGRSRRSSGGATAVRITAILTAVGCCLAAAAYGATRAVSPASDPGPEPDHSPLRPRIFGHPDRVTGDTSAWFAFAQPGRPAGRSRPGTPPRSECRLDAGAWEPCAAPLTLTGIDRGAHRFAVRATNTAGRSSPVADFVWRRTGARPVSKDSPISLPGERRRTPAPTQVDAAPALEVAPTEVDPPPAEKVETPDGDGSFALRQIGVLGDLYPGAPAQTIGVLVENPDDEPVRITSLSAAIAADPPGCPADENFVLTPAAVSAAEPLVVAGEQTVSLPEAGIAGPTIAMANLPRSQDACKDDELQITLSAQAG